MKAPRAVLDLYCGAGGASMGYHRAWPDARIVGVDNVPQPDYPFEFVQGDVAAIAAGTAAFDHTPFGFVHASPPCQAYSAASPTDNDHPDLVAPTRRLLQAWGIPYAIENVVGAPVEASLILCGSMFGLQVQRHRLFELWDGAPLILAPPHNHREWPGDGRPFTVTGNAQRRDVPHSKKHRSLEHAKALMDMPWCTAVRGVTEAIPPAYTAFIATALTEKAPI